MVALLCDDTGIFGAYGALDTAIALALLLSQLHKVALLGPLGLFGLSSDS